MRIVIRVLPLLLLCALAHAAVDKVPQPDKKTDVTYRWPVVTAPQVSAAPAIDGTVGREEWGGMARLAPAIALGSGVQSDDQAISLVGYTDQALYVAFQVHRAPYALEPFSGTDPMTVWRDDCVEFFIRPDFGARYEYNFVGNAGGVHEEGRRETNTDKAWQAKWKYAARRTDWGWECEMEIPFTSLKVPTPKPGDIWEMAPVNNPKTPRGEAAAWSWLHSWTAHEDLGYLIFGGPCVPVRLNAAGELSRNEIGAMVELPNFTPQAQQVNVQLTLYQPLRPETEYFKVIEGAADLYGAATDAASKVDPTKVVEGALKEYKIVAQQSTAVDVPAQQTRVVPLSLAADRGSYVLHYLVTDAASKRLLAGGVLPFFRRAPLELAITPYLISAGVIEATADYRKIATVSEGDQVVIELLGVGETKPLRQVKGTADLAARRVSLDIPVKGLKPGPYTLRCTITAPSGEQKAERSQDFALPAMPAWAGNPYGRPEVADLVPEPWTPMRKTSDGFSVWNRQVSMGSNLQPAQVLNGQTAMLAAPVQMQLQAPGLVWGKPETVRTSKTQIVYRLPVSGANFTGELRLHTEFDGLMRYTLSLTPKAAATLEGLSLQVPVKSSLATHYHHGGLGTPGSNAEVKDPKGYGAVPPAGLALPFTWEVWLGNDEMGLQWCAETDQWWKPADPKQTVIVKPQGETTLLQVNMVGQSRTFDRPIRFEWALLPTPVKPMNHELLHGLRYVQSGLALDESLTKLAPDTEQFIEAIAEGGATGLGQWAWDNKPSLWNEDFGVPGYRPTELNRVRAQAFREAIEMCHRKGIKWVTIYAIWNCVPDWPDVGELWREQAMYPLVSGYGGYRYCPRQPYNDWFVHTLRQTIQDTGIDGVYLDSSPTPHLCTNLHHGCGYVDEEGKLHGTYPVFGCRELHQRIYTLFHGEMRKGGLLYAHNSPFPNPMVESFVDVHHCGEGSTLTRDVAIPKFYGRPFGLPVSFTRWNNPIYPETRMHSWRFALQVDATIKGHPSMIIDKKKFDYKGYGREWYTQQGYDTKGEPLWAIWQAQRAFPWEGATWVPPWRSEQWAQTGDPDVWVCLHVQPKQAALVTVSSFKPETSQISLKLDWQRLGLDPAKVKITDILTQEQLQPQDGAIALEILENRWRMLSVQPL